MEKTVAHICNLTRAERPIQEPVLKVGGRPVFFEETEWPVCAQCGQPMDFLAQFPLREPQRLSERFHMAYVFMCPGKYNEKGTLMCETYIPFSGANAVLLQTRSDRTVIPHREPAYPDYDIVTTLAMEPDVNLDSDEVYEEDFEAVSEETKVGGTPLWLQTNETPICLHCFEPMKFIAQINCALDGRYPAYATKEDLEYMQFLKFEIGYVFICQNDCHPDCAAFLWQCD